MNILRYLSFIEISMVRQKSHLFSSQLKPTIPAAFAISTTSQHGERPTNATVSWQEEGLICVHQWLFDGGGNLQAVNIETDTCVGLVSCCLGKKVKHLRFGQRMLA